MNDDGLLVMDEIKCNHCDKTFDSLAAVGEHVAEQHKGEDED